jgi:hypothetical protein
MTHTQRTHQAHRPDSEDRETVQETTGMTDPAEAGDDAGSEGGSGTAGSDTAEKDQAGSYTRDAEQDPERERHERGDADR